MYAIRSYYALIHGTVRKVLTPFTVGLTLVKFADIFLAIGKG